MDAMPSFDPLDDVQLTKTEHSYEGSKYQAEAIAAGEVKVTPEQVENLARYLLDYHTPEQADGQRSLVGHRTAAGA